MPLFCLVYKSKAHPDFGLFQVRELLQKIRNENRKAQITGCLLLYDGQILQYLEGAQERVVALFEKINKDTRHSEVTLLSQAILGEREFKEWPMAFESLRIENSHLQYLKILVGSFFENNETSLAPNPTSRHFWRAVKLLISTKGVRS